MNPQIGVTELLRYLTGESPEDEARHVQTWCRRSNANAAFMEALRHGGDDSTARLAVDVTRGMKRLRDRLDGTPVSQTSVPRRAFKGREIMGRPSLRRGSWFVAATVVLGLAVLIVSWNAGTHRDSQRTAQASLAYTTGNGERATITLPDSTTVTLNVASRLEVPVDYMMAGHHTVRLVGEGLFTVSHHAGAPFTVLAGTTVARVLGTSFVVRRYATDTATLVAVRDGKVAVGTAVVTAAHLVEVGRTGMPRVRSSDGSPFTFATGELTLTGVPLSTAIAELDRWYDADVRLGSPTLATQQITGDFAAGSLADLDGFLEFTMGVRVVRTGRVLTLYPKQ